MSAVASIKELMSSLMLAELGRWNFVSIVSANK